ncbi:hypothetical protein HY489_04405 [Candidatus Woesearchaeota archaeon]|nr:hypothetical protein [Candidatus Woesearchaeota archaeon]
MIRIYCSEKLDGVAAAAIIMRHAMLTKLPCHFAGFLHPETLTEELQEIAKEKAQLIFMLDASVQPEQLPIIDTIAKNNKIVYWNTTDNQSAIPPAKIFDKAERTSAAQLCQKRFLPQDKTAKTLAELAHQHKYWQIKDDTAIKLADLIQSGHNPLDIITTLSRGMLTTPEFETTHKTYQAKKQTALDELMKNITVKTYLNHRFGFTLAATHLNSAEACQKILDGHAGIDVAVVLYRDGRIVFRRRENTPDVAAIAQIFGGGGQPYAAGAKLSAQITKENLPDTLFKIDQALKNYFVANF